MTTSKAVRNNNFNFLRLVLALLVILSHSTLLLDGNENREPLARLVGFTTFGKLAVECFFLLSGYLIVQSWAQSPNIWRFLKKRILRIYPGFIVASLFCAFVAGPLGAEPHQYFEAFWYGGFLRSVALLRIPIVPDVFKGTPFPVINGSVWTIAYEFILYLTVLAFGSLGLFRRKILWLCSTVFLYSLTLMYTFGLPLLTHSVFFSWAGPLLRLPTFFLMGGCFFLYQDLVRYTSRIAIAITAAVLFCIVGLKIHYFLFAAGWAYLLFYFALMPIDILKGFNNLPDVSYGAYLYGWPVQKLLLWYVAITSPWIVFFSAATLSLFLGAASWYVVEKPFMKFRAPQIGRQTFVFKRGTKS